MGLRAFTLTQLQGQNQRNILFPHNLAFFADFYAISLCENLETVHQVGGGCALCVGGQFVQFESQEMMFAIMEH